MPDLLIELFSEEIPARMQGRAREDLKKLVTDGLVEAGLTYDSAGAFSTPRRLVLSLTGLTAESRPVREERKGPKTDAPAAAIDGFLRATGLTLDQLEARDEKKGQTYYAVVEKPGRKAAEIVAEVLDRTIRSFPWPKSMRWGTGSLRWVRPLHSILCLLSDEGGAEVVPLTVDGIVAGNSTGGHRFMAPARFSVTGFDDYAAKLRRAFVMLDSAEREAHIWNDAQNQAFARGLEVVPDAGLLTEVAGLVEWPVVLLGAIGEAFLGLPPEVLQTSMREHQKFFSVKNPKTGRIEGFVTVANRETADHGATILKGNLKVLSARLSDAKFFWENDLREAKTGMAAWEDGLKAVTFHNKLGSQSDRIARIAALARDIAPLVGAEADQAERAAKLAKLDLRSAMVGEFPELQGTMGRYYALEAGEPEAIANAARDHYSPLGPSDAVPSDPVSVAVALADKIDTLTGFWAIDEKPTGSKDPFALRRAALGVIRLVLGNGVRVGFESVFAKAILDLLDRAFDKLASGTQEEWIARWSNREGGSIEHAAAMLRNFKKFLVVDLASRSLEAQGKFDEASALKETHKINFEAERDEVSLLSFFHDRLKVFLRDQGIRHDVIDACLAMPGNDDLTLLVKRAEALQTFLKTEDGTNLLQGFKRANNILTQAEARDGVEYSFGADPKFAETDAERALFSALDAGEAAIKPAMAQEDFAAAMAAMAQLRAPIDAFFTAVQVNSDNQIVRRNRLNLLHRIRTLVAQVADLTKVEG
ncbi:glycine--tRNA ligase subunit beta [Gemmobacter fulvus]|uniref:Glycine--tRNA ligase beta subunit n=1 Tax=Gemmobacter fulvus TaxID=2840474 RepID=A0A975P6Z0_9RHOB|nr:glycine--tRNA ligase subunit beta [Gemmobacter fulvus]MBT9245397.1 glycine--tRNA ligase subunit beta [Gemmobacter fulvus]QWK90288.1 glycine--tRNA ligase subunit beta [Gemmobacter fulvus]